MTLQLVERPSGILTASTPRRARPRPRVATSGQARMAEPATSQALVPFRQRLAAMPNDQRPTLVASAAPVQITDSASMAMRRTRQAWQDLAWFYFRHIGEVGYANIYVSNAMSRCKLVPARQGKPDEDPEPIDEPFSLEQACLDNIAAGFQGTNRMGGAASMLYSMGMQLQIPGECFWHGSTDEITGANSWEILSTTELQPSGPRGFQILRIPGEMPEPIDPDTSLLSRVWYPDPQMKFLAWSTMAGCLDILEQLWMLTDAGVSSAKSRLAGAGLLLFPDELDYEGTVGPDDEETDFEDELFETIATAIKNQKDANRWVPIVIRGKAEFLDKIRFLSLFKDIRAENASEVQAALDRFAVSFNLPGEIIKGLGDMNHWNAWAVDAATYPHIEPVLKNAVSGVTASVYQPLLVASGMDPARAAQTVIWIDPTDVVTKPDQSAAATQGVNLGAIGRPAWREANGFDESAAPDPDEYEALNTWLHAKESVKSEDTTPPSEAAPATGTPTAPPTPAPGATGPPPPATPPSAKPAGSTPASTPPAKPPSPAPPVAAPVAAAGAIPRRRGGLVSMRAKKLQRLGPKLGAIDRRLLERLQVLADAQLRRAVERAGAKIRSATRGHHLAASRIDGISNLQVASLLGPRGIGALGLEEHNLLVGTEDEYVDTAESWLDDAQVEALTAIADATGQDPQDLIDATEEGRASGRSAAGEVLRAGFATAVSVFLYDPSPGALTPGDGEEQGLAAPRGSIRDALSLAGGGTPEDPTGIGTGGIAVEAMAAGGAEVDGYTWDWGGSDRPFPPHEALDGTEFFGLEDDQLANDEDWPPEDYYYPGDHDGCNCGLIPLVVDRQEAIESGADEADLEAEPSDTEGEGEGDTTGGDQPSDEEEQ